MDASAGSSFVLFIIDLIAYVNKTLKLALKRNIISIFLDFLKRSNINSNIPNKSTKSTGVVPTYFVISLINTKNIATKINAVENLITLVMDKRLLNIYVTRGRKHEIAINMAKYVRVSK
jgi:hypothetical protein